MNKYRIVWTSKFTGKTGHGDGLFTYEQANMIAEKLNESESGEWFTHTVEEVTEESQKEGDE